MPVLPNEVATFVSEKGGLSPEELSKLLESLGRIDSSIKVSVRRPNKSGKGSKQEAAQPIRDAIDYEHERVELRNEKLKKVQEILGCDDPIIEKEEINDEIYPKRLAPTDIVRCIVSAKEKLDELDRKRTLPSKIFMPREEIVLNIMTIIKKFEAKQVALRIAERQKRVVAGKTLEDIQATRVADLQKVRDDIAAEFAETPEEKALREEQEAIDANRTLTFDGNLHNLLDDAAEISAENPEATAAVLRQWIGIGGAVPKEDE